MNPNNEKILSEYKNGDFNQRLNMYLEFSELRMEFIVIDQNDLNRNLSVDFNLSSNSLATQMSLLMASFTAMAKKLFGIASA